MLQGILGREEELRRLAAAFEEVRGGRGRMFLLLGEPGIGKTRLCDELARIADGARVAWGRCFEAGFAPAYWPFTQVIRVIGSERSLAGFPALAMLAPELFPNARPLGGEAREIRFQLFDAMARFLQRVAADGPLLLFLDDLHAADEASLRMLQFVLKSLASSPVMIVGTQRDVAAKTSAEVSAVLHGIGRDAERIVLRRLNAREIEEWIGRDEPERAHELATALHEITEGNPLFVAEVLRVKHARGSATPRIPREVRAALNAHLELADAETREVLTAAAALGREFDEEELVATLGRPIDDVAELLDRAADIGLVVERGGGRRAFVHVLLRDELERALSASARAELHGRIGEVLARRGDRSALARAVHHLAKSASTPDRVIEIARRAAHAASTAQSFDDARAVLDAAAGLLPPGDPRRSNLELDAARAQIRSGEGDAGRARAAQIASVARDRGDVELMARAALVHGTEVLPGRRDATMVKLLDDALVALPASATSLRARLMARLGSALVPGTLENHLRAYDLGKQAIAMSEGLDDETRYAVLQWAIPAAGFVLPAAERAPLVRLLADFAERLDDPHGAVRARSIAFLHAIEEGAGRSAAEALEQTLRVLGISFYTWRISAARSILAVSEGRLDDAARECEEVIRLSREAGVANHAMSSLLRLSLAYAIEDPSYVTDDPIPPDLRAAPFTPFYLAWRFAMARQLDEARRYLAEGQRPMIFAAPTMMQCAGEAAFRLGDRALAAEIYERALADGEPEKNPFIWGPWGAICGGPHAMLLARCAWTAGREDDAIRLFESGIERCRGIFPAHRAQMERDLAQIFLARGERARAAEHLAHARSLGERCGMKYFLEHLPTLEAPRTEARAVAISLTREGEVWRLDGLGATVRLDDRKGVHYLERLLREPNRELHVLDLVGVDDAGDAGAVLDPKAKASYKARLETLQGELEEARRFGDRGRVEKYEAEMDAIAEQLARGVGLGGRDRKAASGAERARVNVQRRIRDVLDRVEAHAPDLGRWLTASVRTGTYCSYVPVAVEQ